MTISKSYEKKLNLLGRYRQEHLLAFFEELDDESREGLLRQIEELDFSKIPGWIEKYIKEETTNLVPTHFEPAPAYPAKPVSRQQQEKYIEAKEIGEKLISEGKVAAFVVAGGQGTRLGFDGPKGDYPISPVKNKTLFGIFGETILATGTKYGTKLRWYVMTSPLNYEATKSVFETNDYYGLDKEDVFIFQQGTLPNFSFDGKILLADKGKIASSPDGHGGSLKALYDSGAVEDMKQKGIEYLSYWQVDNPLIHIFDPTFVGLHVMDKAEMSSKALKKAHAMEKIGNFCLVDGKVKVIEYSDLPDEEAQRRNADGSLTFELGSIGIHVISVDFVEHLNKDGFALPFHRAVKKIPHIDTKGNIIKPTESNGVKLETFVFDALPLAERSVIYETIRSEEFAPVKNANGDDSPEVTRRMMTERGAAWLECAGIDVPRDSKGRPDCVVEIAPGFALCKEDLHDKVKEIGPIKPGNRVYLA